MSDIVVTPRVRIPSDELREHFVRSGGAGGQNVNKVASKVELRWTPSTSSALSFDDKAWVMTKLGGRLTLDGDLIVTSDRYRDQLRNRADAAEKLAVIVRGALARPKPRRATRPSRGANTRRIAAKKRRGAIKSTRRDGGGDE